MAAQLYFIDIPLTGRTEKRDGYWASYNDQLGLVTYGADSDEAMARTQTGIGMIVDYLWSKGEDVAVRRWLERAGAFYSIQPAEDVQVRRYQATERRQLASL